MPPALSAPGSRTFVGRPFDVVSWIQPERLPRPCVRSLIRSWWARRGLGQKLVSPVREAYGSTRSRGRQPARAQGPGVGSWERTRPSSSAARSIWAPPPSPVSITDGRPPTRDRRGPCFGSIACVMCGWSKATPCCGVDLGGPDKKRQAHTQHCRRRRRRPNASNKSGGNRSIDRLIDRSIGGVWCVRACPQGREEEGGGRATNKHTHTQQTNKNKNKNHLSTKDRSPKIYIYFILFFFCFYRFEFGARDPEFTDPLARPGPSEPRPCSAPRATGGRPAPMPG